VTVLLGLTMGLSLFSLAGARRTQSSYPRFLRSADASTMSVSLPGNYDETNPAVAAFPEVLRSRTYVGFQVYVLAHDQPDFAQTFEASGTFDGRVFDQDQFTATRGRRPNPEVADEVAVNELTAERFGYHVGQHLDLATYSMEQFSDPSFFRAPPPPKVRTSATIVGIGVFPDEILQDQADHTTRLLLTPAFSAPARAYATYSFQGLVLRNGDADVDAVQAAAHHPRPGGHDRHPGHVGRPVPRAAGHSADLSCSRGLRRHQCGSGDRSRLPGARWPGPPAGRGG